MSAERKGNADGRGGTESPRTMDTLSRDGSSARRAKREDRVQWGCCEIRIICDMREMP